MGGGEKLNVMVTCTLQMSATHLFTNISHADDVFIAISLTPKLHNPKIRKITKQMMNLLSFKISGRDTFF